MTPPFASTAPEFQPGDEVRARLWPELGRGEVLSVTKQSPAGATAARAAMIRWSSGQVSTHGFVALAYAVPEVAL